MSLKWQLTSPQSLHMRVWDTEAVIYDAASGNTHLLDQRAARVLAELRRAPAGTAALAQALMLLEPECDIAATQASLQAVLAELAGISLITSASS